MCVSHSSTVDRLVTSKSLVNSARATKHALMVNARHSRHVRIQGAVGVSVQVPPIVSVLGHQRAITSVLII